MNYVDNLWITQSGIRPIFLKIINQNAAFVNHLFRKYTFLTNTRIFPKDTLFFTSQIQSYQPFTKLSTYVDNFVNNLESVKTKAIPVYTHSPSDDRSWKPAHNLAHCYVDNLWITFLIAIDLLL